MHNAKEGIHRVADEFVFAWAQGSDVITLMLHDEIFLLLSSHGEAHRLTPKPYLFVGDAVDGSIGPLGGSGGDGLGVGG